MNLKTIVIVIAQPDCFRESIQVLLTSIPLIDEIIPIESINEAMRLATMIKPAIVILDSQVANLDLPDMLKLIGDVWQEASRIILLEDRNEFQQVTAYGADTVLLKGFTVSRFIDEIEKVLVDR